MLLYYITDRHQFPGLERQQRERLLATIAEAARCGVDLIQLREKDLCPRELLSLAQAAIEIVREASEEVAPAPDSPPNAGCRTRLLINSRLDVALAAGADGVHLTSADITASDARAVWEKAHSQHAASVRGEFLIGVSCHTTADVRLADAHGADFAVFAPVFEKVAVPQRPGAGLDVLKDACRTPGRPLGPEGIGATHMPVLALGGVTPENAGLCMQAGASGIAGIRLFQQNSISEVVARLRALNNW